MPSDKKLVRILIVEDELIIAAHITQVLTNYGHTVIETITKGEKVPGFIANNIPELILMDINLAGQLDGIETAKIIAETAKIPVIFLTANVAEGTFEKSKEAFPYAFISKPFKPEELLRTIDLIMSRIDRNDSAEHTENDSNEERREFDFIFIKDKDKMVKVHLSDIYYIVAERNYSKVHTASKVFLLSTTLKSVEAKINSKVMQRIHRSYLVNTSVIDELNDNYVFIKGKSIPISKSFKKELTQKLKLL